MKTIRVEINRLLFVTRGVLIEHQADGWYLAKLHDNHPVYEATEVGPFATALRAYHYGLTQPVFLGV